MKISIVIISFNQGEFLEHTIKSVVEQSYDDKEIILIDGGSTDKSCKIIENYKQYFKYWVSEPDKGQAEAILKGFNKCSGDILTWLNSDDVLCDGALEHVAKTAIRYRNINAVFYGDTLVINEHNTVQEKFHYGFFNRFVSKTLGPTVSQPGTFFGRGVYQKIGGIDLNFCYGMDYDLFCNFLFSEIPYYYTGKYMAKFRKHSAQKGHSAHYLEICNRETLIIQNRYGYNLQSKENKIKARIQRLTERIFNGYYLVSFSYRLFKRGTLKEFNPYYSE